MTVQSLLLTHAVKEIAEGSAELFRSQGDTFTQEDLFAQVETFKKVTNISCEPNVEEIEITVTYLQDEIEDFASDCKDSYMFVADAYSPKTKNSYFLPLVPHEKVLGFNVNEKSVDAYGAPLVAAAIIESMRAYEFLNSVKAKVVVNNIQKIDSDNEAFLEAQDVFDKSDICDLITQLAQKLSVDPANVQFALQRIGADAAYKIKISERNRMIEIGNNYIREIMSGGRPHLIDLPVGANKFVESVVWELHKKERVTGERLFRTAAIARQNVFGVDMTGSAESE